MKCIISINNKSVIRGIHYQKQPSPISKIVTCVEGKVLDFVIDLREDSPNYKKYTTLTYKEMKIFLFLSLMDLVMVLVY